MMTVSPHAQRFVSPVRGGTATTVTSRVAAQPVDIAVYDIAAVPPAIPDTSPPLLIRAMVVSLLLHVPPGMGSVNKVDVPRQMPDIPTMPEGMGRISIDFVTVHPAPME